MTHNYDDCSYFIENIHNKMRRARLEGLAADDVLCSASFYRDMQDVDVGKSDYQEYTCTQGPRHGKT